jgi:3-dehydroquinate synthase
MFPNYQFDRKAQNTIIDYLKHDKKNTHGRVNFVLLKDVGQYVLDCHINQEQIYAAFDFWQQNTTAKSH